MRKLLYLLASAAVMAGGCSEKKETPAGEGCGTIRIACEADATIDAAAAMAAVQGATRSAAKPDGKDFTLRIRGENFDKSWATVAAYNAEETAYTFPEGRYAITVTYGDPEAEGADKPYYAGATEVEVAARRTSTAQITATIGNAQTLVRATESFKKYYNNAEFTVTTGAGSIFTRAVPYTPTASCGMVVPSSGTVNICFLASSVPLRIASGISTALPMPQPTRPFSSPTTISAENFMTRPPLTVLLTRFR